MVPQPTPWTGPSDPRLVDPTIALESSVPVPPLPFLRNTSGRPWKQSHNATVRAQAPKVAAGSAWSKRLEARKKDEAVKKLEKCAPNPTAWTPSSRSADAFCVLGTAT